MDATLTRYAPLLAAVTLGLVIAATVSGATPLNSDAVVGTLVLLMGMAAWGKMGSGDSEGRSLQEAPVKG